MNTTRCAALKRELDSQPGPPIVEIGRYFDGNDDEASIGCNLSQHPGMSAFRDILTGLKTRADVRAVYALIAEVDPGEGYWPFTDTIVVVGTIPPEALQRLLEPLSPDEVSVGDPTSLPDSLSDADRAVALIAWWD